MLVIIILAALNLRAKDMIIEISNGHIFTKYLHSIYDLLIVLYFSLDFISLRYNLPIFWCCSGNSLKSAFSCFQVNTNVNSPSSRLLGRLSSVKDYLYILVHL